MPNWKKVVTSGSAAELSTLSLTGLSAQSSETDVLTINTSNVLGTRQLSSGAFTTISYGISTGDIVKFASDAANGDFIKIDGTDIVGRSAAEVKSDLSLNNVENTAISTYTGNGGALDNQYITNGANYVTAAVTLTTAAQSNITSLGTLTSLTVDDITINGSTISDGGDLTMDIGGDLVIDVDGTDIILKDAGTAFGRFKRDSSDFIIKSEANNEDMIFRGQDGGATIDALLLDMSDKGTAYFNHHVSASGNVTGVTGSFQALVGDTSQATSLEVDGPITASGGIISDNIETFWTSFNVDGDANFATSIYGPNTQGINYYFWNKNWTSTTADGGNPTGDQVHRSEINSGWYVPYKIKIVALCGGLHDGSAASTTDCEVGIWNTAASFASSDYDTNTGTTKEFIVSGSVTLNGNRWKHFSATCDVTLDEGQYVLPRVRMGENLTNLRGQFTIKYKRVV